jgi:hypothetical protein
VESDKFFRGDIDTSHRPKKLFVFLFFSRMPVVLEREPSPQNRVAVSDRDKEMNVVDQSPYRTERLIKQRLGICDDE